MEEAYRKLYPGDDVFCEFLHAGGATNIPPYLKTAKVLSKEFSHAVIGLFDRDQEGRKQIKEFSSSGHIEDTEFYEISSERMLYAGLLALPEALQPIEEEIKNSTASELNLPIPIEFMFPAEVISEALEMGIIELEDRIAKANDPELPTTINLSDFYSNKLPDGSEYLAKKVKKSTKTKFSRWVACKPTESFESFRIVFEQLKMVINTNQ